MQTIIKKYHIKFADCEKYANHVYAEFIALQTTDALIQAEKRAESSCSQGDEFFKERTTLELSEQRDLSSPESVNEQPISDLIDK
jgi:hypothetical protein